MEKVEVTLSIDRPAYRYYQQLTFDYGIPEEELMAKILYAAAIAIRYLEPPENQNRRTR